MTRVTLRGFAQRKLRALVTTLAVFLGVAFIAGGYVLTDTINASFDEILGDAFVRTDVSFSPTTRGNADDIQAPPFPEEFLDRVRAVDGVKAAEGGIFSVGRFVDEKGDPLTRGFAPNFIASATPEPFETLTASQRREVDAEAERLADFCA